MEGEAAARLLFSTNTGALGLGRGRGGRPVVVRSGRSARRRGRVDRSESHSGSVEGAGRAVASWSDRPSYPHMPTRTAAASVDQTVDADCRSYGDLRVKSAEVVYRYENADGVAAGSVRRGA